MSHSCILHSLRGIGIADTHTHTTAVHGHKTIIKTSIQSHSYPHSHSNKNKKITHRDRTQQGSQHFFFFLQGRRPIFVRHYHEKKKKKTNIYSSIKLVFVSEMVPHVFIHMQDRVFTQAYRNTGKKKKKIVHIIKCMNMYNHANTHSKIYMSKFLHTWTIHSHVITCQYKFSFFLF